MAARDDDKELTDEDIKMLAEREERHQRRLRLFATLVRISAIVDACFRLIVDGVSMPSWTRNGCAQAGSQMYLNRPRSV